MRDLGEAETEPGTVVELADTADLRGDLLSRTLGNRVRDALKVGELALSPSHEREGGNDNAEPSGFAVYANLKV